MGLHRLDVYYDLKSLQDREMVEATLSRPMVYRARSLVSILANLEDANRLEISRRAQAISTLRDASKNFDNSGYRRGEREEVGDGNTIRIISGRKAVRAKWLDLLESAKREVLIAATEKGPARSIFLESVDYLSAKVRRGVRVKVFTPIGGTYDQRLKRLKSNVRHMASSTPAGLCVIDRTTAMIVLSQSKTRGSAAETALVTGSRSIGEMLRTLFFVGWTTSPSFEKPSRTASVSRIVSDPSKHQRTLK